MAKSRTYVARTWLHPFFVCLFFPVHKITLCGAPKNSARVRSRAQTRLTIGRGCLRIRKTRTSFYPTAFLLTNSVRNFQRTDRVWLHYATSRMRKPLTCSSSVSTGTTCNQKRKEDSLISKTARGHSSNVEHCLVVQNLRTRLLDNFLFWNDDKNVDTINNAAKATVHVQSAKLVSKLIRSFVNFIPSHFFETTHHFATTQIRDFQNAPLPLSVSVSIECQVEDLCLS